jgi:bifunctional isochorismate lyase/aryl carrier protein
MAIPPIRPYPMPVPDELPPPVPSWWPDPDRALLLIHDMQRYFVDRYPGGKSPLVPLLSNVDRLRRAATAARVPVAYTVQPAPVSREQRGLMYDFWGPGMGDDPQARQIVPALAPGPRDTVVVKRRYSAFHDTALAALLRQQGRDQLVVCGVYAHIGCLVTLYDAVMRNIQPFLVADAVAGFTAADHRMALHHAARTCAVVLPTDRMVAALGTVARPRLLLDDAGQLYP